MIFSRNKKICGIYSITNTINGKIYIGYTNNLYTRKSLHFSQLIKNKHANFYLQASYNKYGKENFKFEIIEECEEKFLCSLENYWCNLLNSHNRNFGYNIKPTGDKISMSVSLETKLKMSKTKKGKIPKNINLFKQSTLGRKRPFEETSKISERQKRPILQYTKDMIFIKEYSSALDAGIELNIKHSINLNKCANNPKGKDITAYGYIWRYKDGKSNRGAGAKR